MHELAIAEEMMKSAEQFGEKNDAKAVTNITVKIGEMSGIVDECLQMYHSLLKNDYPLLKDSTLTTQIDEVIYECSNCKTRYNPRETDYECPNCHSTAGTIIQGTDFIIDSIKIIENNK